MTTLKPAAVPRFDRGAGLELAARRAVDGLYAGRHRSPRIGSSLDFADHRAYQDGDDLGDIDWKAYARTDRLLVRRWHDDRQLPLALLVDTSASMGYGEPAKGDIARLAAAVLGLLAFDQGDRVRLLLAGRQEPMVPTEAVPLCAALGATADAGTAAAPALLLRAAATLPQRHLAILLGDLLDEPEELLAAAGALYARGHELAVIQILDRSELELPANWGPTRFTDPEGGPLAVEGDAAELAATYAEAFATHQERLASGFAGLGADHLVLATDAVVPDVLGAWLARRSHR